MGRTSSSKASGTRFTPWGFNYLGEFGTVFEEYWAEKWPAIEEDFREMRKLGANVIRVHLQLPTYMAGPDQTRPEELARLRRLLDLARDQGLYLDLTGLGCYRLAQVPKWLDALSESERWATQARFWEAIAETCKGHPAVFCYDLMNEPVITAAKEGEHPWLTGEMGGFHFVQRIANQLGKRTQAEIAAAWVAQMAGAIRKADPEGLITVGVIPWAMIWPNAKPVFYAPAAAKHLDFVSVHFYPQKGKVREALTAPEGLRHRQADRGRRDVSAELLAGRVGRVHPRRGRDRGRLDQPLLRQVDRRLSQGNRPEQRR